MCKLQTWAWAVALAAATASPAFAQITSSTVSPTGTTTTTTGGTRTTGTTGGTGGIASGGASTAPGGTRSGTTSGSGTGSNSTTITPEIINNLDSLQQQNIQYSNIGMTGTSTMQRSNVFGGFYGNPMAMGLPTTAGAGGFGAPTFGATTGTGTVTGGRAGATGAGQRGLATNTNTQSGILIPLPVRISYVAQMRFPTPPVASPVLVADLRGIIDRGGFANPKSVQVIANGTDITLRGTVKDDDEARLAEGLVRLTPGVGTITNELSYPLASK